MLVHVRRVISSFHNDARPAVSFNRSFFPSSRVIRTGPSTILPYFIDEEVLLRFLPNHWSLHSTSAAFARGGRPTTTHATMSHCDLVIEKIRPSNTAAIGKRVSTTADLVRRCDNKDCEKECERIETCNCETERTCDIENSTATGDAFVSSMDTSANSSTEDRRDLNDREDENGCTDDVERVRGIFYVRDRTRSESSSLDLVSTKNESRSGNASLTFAVATTAEQIDREQCVRRNACDGDTIVAREDASNEDAIREARARKRKKKKRKKKSSDRRARDEIERMMSRIETGKNIMDTFDEVDERRDESPRDTVDFVDVRGDNNCIVDASASANRRIATTIAPNSFAPEPPTSTSTILHRRRRIIERPLDGRVVRLSRKRFESCPDYDSLRTFRIVRTALSTLANDNSERIDVLRTWFRFGRDERGFGGNVALWFEVLFSLVMKRPFRVKDKQLIKFFAHKVFHVEEQTIEERVYEFERANNEVSSVGSKNSLSIVRDDRERNNGITKSVRRRINGRRLPIVLSEMYATGAKCKVRTIESLTLEEVWRHVLTLESEPNVSRRNALLKKLILKCTAENVEEIVRMLLSVPNIRLTRKHLVQVFDRRAYDAWRGKKVKTFKKDLFDELMSSMDFRSVLNDSTPIVGDDSSIVRDSAYSFRPRKRKRSEQDTTTDCDEDDENEDIDGNDNDNDARIEKLKVVENVDRDRCDENIANTKKCADHRSKKRIASTVVSSDMVFPCSRCLSSVSSASTACSRSNESPPPRSHDRVTIDAQTQTDEIANSSERSVPRTRTVGTSPIPERKSDPVIVVRRTVSENERSNLKLYGANIVASTTARSSNNNNNNVCNVTDSVSTPLVSAAVVSNDNDRTTCSNPSKPREIYERGVVYRRPPFRGASYIPYEIMYPPPPYLTIPLTANDARDVYARSDLNETISNLVSRYLSSGTHEPGAQESSATSIANSSETLPQSSMTTTVANTADTFVASERENETSIDNESFVPLVGRERDERSSGRPSLEERMFLQSLSLEPVVKSSDSTKKSMRTKSSFEFVEEE